MKCITKELHDENKTQQLELAYRVNINTEKSCGLAQTAFHKQFILDVRMQHGQFLVAETDLSDSHVPTPKNVLSADRILQNAT